MLLHVARLEYGYGTVTIYFLLICLVDIITPEISECGTNAKKFQTRIVGGRPADPDEYPWLVALLRPATTGSGQFCGATLISESIVITAAHCIQP